ncbi:MAG: ATP-binding cassette domain-containing protein [Clostridiales bacterium]|jgi:ABC-type lipoprotein export system ATPase subunit|nr:ATP-binding cassette domain-containing protein [Clostridiales bacterium]
MTLTICAGTDKDGNREGFGRLDLRSGTLYALCGHTGAGKSQLIKDVEMLVNRDSVSRRLILADGRIPDRSDTGLIAHLGQNMRFVLDVGAAQFVEMHLACRRNASVRVADVLKLANSITSETVRGGDSLLALSGGQSRALMIADVALVCDSPIVLIDEIENAGVDKAAALDALLGKDKLVLIVTHDPHTMLLAAARIILANGAIQKVVRRTDAELAESKRLTELYEGMNALRNRLREGGEVES